MGYHRLLTHRSYKAPKWVEYLFTIFATMTLEGGPIFWVATHRIHHRHTDKPGDPHSPRDGKWWSHMGWITSGKAMHRSTEELAPYARDLVKDRFHVWISKWHWVPLTVSGLLILAVFGWQVTLVGGLPARHAGAALHLAGEFRDASVGLAALRHGRTIRATASGSRSSPSAKAGTTTTMRTCIRRVTACAGGRST